MTLPQSAALGVRAALQWAGRTGLDLLAPAVCPGCAAPLEGRGPFCGPCELGLTPRDPSGCVACERPAGASGLCRSCKLRLAPLSAAQATFDYGGPLAAAIQRFKYEGQDGLAGALVDRWLQEKPIVLDGAWLIAPVPLHRARLARRGYDQAWLLARRLARALGQPAEPRALRRLRSTRPQVGLGRAAREHNVRGAFSAAPSVQGQRVLLVDDVLTTGATLAACASSLRAAGARQVAALALGRAPQ